MKLLKFRSIIIITALLLVLAVGLLIEDQEIPAETLTLQIQNGESAEQISAWADENGDYYFFLPGYAELQSSQLLASSRTNICLNDIKLENGVSCKEFDLNVPYTLTYRFRGRQHKATLTFLQSANIATMYVDTQSGSMDYIHGTQGNEETGHVRIYLHNGLPDYQGSMKSCSGRGNSTWNEYEKKPYDIKLDSPGNLLSMGTAESWILLANASDASNMRNKIVYEFAAQAGMQYSPECQWVDLYLNGLYAGLYLLCEKNEIHSERLNLEGSAFLVSQEVESRLLSKNAPYIKTENGQILRIRETTMPAAEMNVIWQSAENAIISADGYDETTGKAWHELIDLDSWARKFLIEEAFGNVDAGYASQYYYYDQSNSKIYAGPVWDYDYAMYEKDAFFALRYEVKEGLTSPWYSSLFQKKLFQSYVKELWENEYVPLLQKVIAEEMDDYSQTIEKAAETDAVRWKRKPEDFYAAVDQVKDNLMGRTSFLSSVWLENALYCYVQVDRGTGQNMTVHAVEPGENLEQVLAIEDKDFLGWYNRKTNEKIDPAAPIHEDMSIYALWSPSWNWRHLAELLPPAMIAILFLSIFFAEITGSYDRNLRLFGKRKDTKQL